ncbi:hypothetical protein AMJ44_15600 [candidate division WOR-1 bacterium DG_54_3]|uniref:Uncharacterized protein n=1 Tax=candidate division WOR-1 bacterium DG_54_3 TaxID=1703775 RepID=A0A0S7XJ98_UNCSA|nr:MAG: hypothetical protein AMJ44_15600 [candidate division WOR-1 bacterium DG_54_3]
MPYYVYILECANKTLYSKPFKMAFAAMKGVGKKKGKGWKRKRTRNISICLSKNLIICNFVDNLYNIGSK